MMKLYIKYLKSIAVIAFFILFWIVISQTNWANKSPNNLWFAKYDEVFFAIVQIIKEQTSHIYSSFIRVFISSSIVIVFGVISGLIIGYFKSAYDSMKLSIDFWRSIPPIIVIPIMYRWDPSGPNEYYWRIALVLFGCLPIMTMLIADATNSSSKKRLLIFYSINASLLFKIKSIIFYEILPELFSGIRTILSFAIIIIVVSEMVLAPEKGIGRQILHYQTAYEIQFVYAYAILVGIIGIALNYTARTVERKLIFWN